MEVAGLVIGGVSFAGLFTTCVNCFEYVQLGRHFGRDWQTAVLKLDLLKLRLSRWADAMSAYDGDQPEADVKKVGETLAQIIYLFEGAERTSKRFSDSQQTSQVYTDADLDDGVGSIHLKIMDLALKRQKRTSFAKKAAWALYEEKHFNRLIEDVSPLVRDLVELFPPVQETQKQLSLEEAEHLKSEKAIATLQEANSGEDDLLQVSLAQATASQLKHQFERNFVTGNTLARYGDEVEGNHGPQGLGSAYRQNRAEGGVVHYGDRYGDSGGRNSIFDAVRKF
ncbi:hypothetical protein H9Q74_007347 [Fusarium xylarioides]|nr:hypothetical protein H9Q71_010211 [Fusarium xylarioides]KAG5822573.1 hypothetical protein H9Q74_007347 [Fusarium xylarioides]